MTVTASSNGKSLTGKNNAIRTPASGALPINTMAVQKATVITTTTGCQPGTSLATAQPCSSAANMIGKISPPVHRHSMHHWANRSLQAASANNAPAPSVADRVPIVWI